MYPIKESFLAHVKFLFLQDVVFSSKLSQVRKLIIFDYVLYILYLYIILDSHVQRTEPYFPDDHTSPFRN